MTEILAKVTKVLLCRAMCIIYTFTSYIVAAEFYITNFGGIVSRTSMLFFSIIVCCIFLLLQLLTADCF